MKTASKFSLVLILAGSLCPASAQVTFTRILEGDIATDTGYFWGCAWGDYDHDGNVDLFVCSSVPSGSVTNRLYHNNGNGTFTRITTGTLVNERADSDAAVWGDFDNDGDLDLFVSNALSPARDFFYRNEGDGTFTKVTQGDWVTDSGAGVGAAWADYDSDGYLDLYVVNTLYQNDFLYHNNRDGTMTKITAGPIFGGGGAMGCAWADYDGDGDLDLFVANAGPGQPQKDVQFRNDGNGVFTRILTGPQVTEAGLSLGVAWGDYDNDGDLDLFVTQIGTESNRLYRNGGSNGFVRITAGAIVNDGGSSISAAWGDYDNDGYLDLFISRTRMDGAPENNWLYHNEGDGTFSKVTAGAVVTDVARSFGCAWADYDNDGDLDLFVANGGYSSPPGESCFLYRNDGGTNNWILMRLVGTVSNRSAIGAKVRVKATIQGKTFWQLREISGGSGYCSQNDLRAHFGLGNATNVEVVRIEWPSGIVQELHDVPAKQTLTVTEPVRLQATGRGQFQFKSWKGQVFTIQASSDLTAWNSIATVTNLTGTVEFTDPEAGLSAQRFYRVVTP